MKYNFFTKRSLLLVTLATGFSFWTLVVSAQEKKLTYQLPPQSIVDLVDAPTTPSVRFNGNGSLMLILQEPGYRPMSQVAQPIVGAAGVRVNPRNNSTEAELAGVFTGLTLKDVKTGKTLAVTGLPTDMRMANMAWSADGKKLAFSNNTYTGVELWVLNVETLVAKRLTQGLLNDALGTTLQWNPNSQQILAQFIVDNRGALPVENIIPDGPIVQENLGKVSPDRTYTYLLENEHDERVMEYYLSSQLKAVNLDGTATNVGKPAMYKSVNYSPDGQYMLASTVSKPYSYQVPVQSFPFELNLLSASGTLVKQLQKASTGGGGGGFGGATGPGPRGYQWRSDAPSTLVYSQAVPKADPKSREETGDDIYLLAAPFTGEAKKFYTTAASFSGMEWGNEKYALVKEASRTARTSKTTLIDPQTGAVIKVIADGSSEDTYKNPGRFIYTKGQFGENVLLFDKGNTPIVFTQGNGSSPIGDRPFVMKWNLISGKQDTLFKSKAPYYEEPTFFDNTGVVYVSRESATTPPNMVLVNLKSKKEQALTTFPNPYPSLEGVQKTLINYPRKDGVKLSAMMYLPKGYKKEDGKLPALVWAYPREFKSAEAAGQVKGSPYRFTSLVFRSPVYWVTRGYAVLDNADMPIIGEGKVEPNDTFVEQIEQNAIALINYVSDDLGVVDRTRMGVGGHSYGAFMTANLLAHTNLFAAGIARSGAYNRTLTPFGFQGERRTFWEAEAVYDKMSPFNYANKIKLPLLMTHGADDENSGTFPVQSERLYAAIKGHGGTVRLVVFPKEFHGYRSRESVMHTFWETDRWLEQYVKNKKPSTETVK